MVRRYSEIPDSLITCGAGIHPGRCRQAWKPSGFGKAGVHLSYDEMASPLILMGTRRF
jgi:hypothetical protein